MDTQLLKTLCTIHAPSGNEQAMKEFIINYAHTHRENWKVVPEVIYGEELQDCVLMVFGSPRTAVFAHMDSIGYTVRYGNELVKIGGPAAGNGARLVGRDSQGDIVCTLVEDSEGNQSADFHREIDRGTELVYQCDFREDDDFVQSCYLDNRLGVYSALKLAETLQNGILAFSCWEEHGGGSVAYLAEHIYQRYSVRQALISDITWVTEGVRHGEGVAISMRDRSIPRRSFVNRIIDLAGKSKIPFQLEVEGSGGSDGKELQAANAPWNWCFVGAPEDNVHTPDEKVHKADIEAMIDLYEYLMRKL